MIEVPATSSKTRKVELHQTDSLIDVQEFSRPPSCGPIRNGESDLRDLLQCKEFLSRLGRELPRLHTFVYSIAQSETSSNRKVGPLDIKYHEFMNGFQTSVRRLSLLPTYTNTLKEIAEYIQSLSAKRRDYQPFEVLLFNDNFRRFTEFNGSALNDFSAFSSSVH